MDRRWRLYAVGVLLCLLAAVFAIEAKVAWFSPAGSAPAQISASKLQPVDGSRLHGHTLAAHLQRPADTPLPHILAVAVAIVIAVPFRRPVRDAAIPQVSPEFIPPLFRRPPPQSI